jgi:mono/diheme cytochrome c family protein
VYVKTLVVAVALLLMLGTGSRAQNTPPNTQAATPAGNAESGKQLFAKYGCYECHGREAQGSSATGPRLGPNPIPFARFIAYIRKPSGEMPPYTAKVVPDKDAADLYAFLQSLPKPPEPASIPLLAAPK